MNNRDSSQAIRADGAGLSQLGGQRDWKHLLTNILPRNNQALFQCSIEYVHNMFYSWPECNMARLDDGPSEPGNFYVPILIFLRQFSRVKQK